MSGVLNLSSFSASLRAAVSAAQSGSASVSSDGVSTSISGLVELNLQQLVELRVISQLLAQIAGINDSDLTAMRGDPGILT